MEGTRKLRATLFLALSGFGALCAGSALGREPTQTVTESQAKFFETRVRPLLAERCYSCHGAAKQAAGLRLDSAESILKGGASGPAITAGEPDKSALIRNIRHDGPVKMPPTGKLRSDEIMALTEWVKMGAPWPKATSPPERGRPAGGMVITDEHRRFWAFRPVKRPAIPGVKNAAWVKNPIDAFVLARLEANGLKPAPTADRRTLVRRAFLDLIGLPPSVDEARKYLGDTSPQWYERMIDALLASPHYGERWGRHWLDVVRYADSNGLDENKAFAHAFRYRDYVIDSLNRDKPYDRFLTEQLAGDLLPADSDAQRNEQTTATGMLVLGAKVLAEQDKPKLVMDIVDEQIEVVSKAMMGLTVACARCHDHKFDPITTKDYYALAGIFKSTRTMKDLGFVSNWMEKPLLTDALRAQEKAHGEKLAGIRRIRAEAVAAANEEVVLSQRKSAARYLLAGWELAQGGGLFSVAESPQKPGETRILIEAEKFARGKDVVADLNGYGEGIGVIINVGSRDEIEWDVDVPSGGPYQLELRYAAAEARPVRLYLNGKLLKDSAAGAITGSWNPDGQRWETQGVFAFEQGKNTLRIERDGPIPHFDKLLVASTERRAGKPSRTADEIAKAHGVDVGVLNKWAQRLRSAAGDRFLSGFQQFASIPESEFGTRARDLAAAISKGEARTVAAEFSAFFKDFAPASLAEVAARYEAIINGPKNPLPERFDLPEKPERLYSESAKAKIKEADAAIKSVESGAPAIPIAMAVEEAPRIENVRVHIRGDTLNLGEEVPRRFLTVLNGERSRIASSRSGRLELAHWLTAKEHPLTSRVAVNRMWQGHFGQGLVRTPDNWGRLGEKPTHPELLDWLAAEFMESTVAASGASRWSSKAMHRLIMTSNTYRMSVARNERAAAADPENRLLWRMNRRRLEAEPFRDSLLAVSGNLDRSMGGSLLTTKNNDYVTNDQSGNAARYDNHRRSVYLPVIRNAVFDMFQAFDFGDPSMVNAKRASTTVAPQALYIVNAPFALEQARVFALKLLGEAALRDDTRIERAYFTAYCRPATPAETARARAYLVRYERALAGSGVDADKRREMAWTSFCQILLASNEFIYVN